MPVGGVVLSKVSYTEFSSCDFKWTDAIGLALMPVPGVKIVDGVTVTNFNSSLTDDVGSTVYTSPQAEMRGLGYVVHFEPVRMYDSCHFEGEGWVLINKYWPGGMVEDGQIHWLGARTHCAGNDINSGGFFWYKFSLFLVKIGNRIQGAQLPANFTVPLKKYHFYWNGVLQHNSEIRLEVINFDTDSAVSPSCTTPTASESTIYLGMFNQQAIQQLPAGTEVPLSARQFHFTFDCPVSTWQAISFFVEPMHGKADGAYGDMGVMNIAQGTGMAAGIGVRLQLNTVETGGWRDVVYRTSPPYNTEYGVQYGKYRIGNTLQVPFRASLIRLPEPVVAGQVKAAALIHVRYN